MVARILRQVILFLQRNDRIDYLVCLGDPIFMGLFSSGYTE